MEGAPDVFRKEVGLMLGHISVYQQNEETCVEELSIEHSISNTGLLGTASVFSNPNDELDDDQLQDNVHSNNDEGDGLSDDLRPQNVVGVLEANGLIEVMLLHLVRFILVHSLLSLMLAEALQSS
eukprot:CAMPEP_0170503222 /NCGR_PEP_ID=MMETSP0208-20121228/44015_1 /TAXON_ID=197538 /ORGANISM="Strombidium inclinatum, Strain S3" /LENGTH=124 /DNA_ID=CAMNT_0010782763 /DNA_START=1259 /DNA_END=1633 /DNA_ORIENTATION=+